MAEVPSCEQVGFIVPKQGGEDIRLSMAGGEFCGNASVCAAALSIFCSLLGILISILAGTPVGSTIVAVDILLFFAFSAFGAILGGVRA